MKESIERKLIQKRSEILNSRELTALAAIESEISYGFLEYCRSKGFKLIDVPHMTKATGACENFLTIFDVDFFGEQVYLSQTGQLYLEAFLHQPGFERTCCIGPSFRREEKVDDRHAIEFPLLEVEIADCDLRKLRYHAEGILSTMASNVSEKCTEDLDVLGVPPEWLKTFRPPYEVITYEKAITTLGLSWGSDLKAEHEQALVEWNGQKPLFVTHYPQEIKFFNMRLNREDTKVVNSMDLLFPYSGECLGAAEREEDYLTLRKRLEDSEMLSLMQQVIKKEPGMQDKTDFQIKADAISRFDWYLDLIRKHPVKHAGFGMGKNRIFQSMVASEDIRAAGSYIVNKETIL